MEIKFTDLHDKLFQYKSRLIDKENLYNWLDENVEVKSYMPLSSKYAIISVFSERFERDTEKYSIEDNGLDYLYMTYDINMLFDVFFRYTDIVVISKYRTLENYDLIMESGFYDYVLQKCKLDYIELKSKCDRLTGIDNLIIINELKTIFTKPISVEDIERVRDVVNNEIDPEKLKILETIESYNNPILAKVLDTISKDVIKETFKKGD